LTLVASDESSAPTNLTVTVLPTYADRLNVRWAYDPALAFE
jgi:hypothetical protein